MKPAYAFVMLAAGGLGLVSAAPAETKVGLILPYCGTYAALGNNITDGFNFAIEQAGRADNFTILQEDTEVKLSVGLAMPRKLVLEDEVDVLGGIVSSGALRNFVDGAEIPLIVANAGNNKATGEACSPFITRVSLSNAQVNRPMGSWLVDQGIKKVYTLVPDYAAGLQMIEAFSAHFNDAGGEVVGASLPCSAKQWTLVTI